jgi:hypothetical protein
MKLKRRTCLGALLGCAVPAGVGWAQAPEPGVQNETWLDPSRQREVPVTVRWPTAQATSGEALPVVLFSHGLGGTREGGAVWGQAWAAAGFVVLHLQHPGSDLAAVRVGATPERRRAVFDALPTSDKAQLVLEDADHMTFAGQTGRAVEIVPREQVTRDLQPAHHALIASISTQWWRATLLGDSAAQAWLATPPGLSSGDHWQQK